MDTCPEGSGETYARSVERIKGARRMMDERREKVEGDGDKTETGRSGKGATEGAVEGGVILGKSTLRVRVCSCPVRDMKNEEADSSGTSQQSIKRASTDCGGGAESKQFRANEGRPFYLDGLDAEVAYKLSRLLPVPCDENDVGSRNFLYPDS
ncbi:unnamed protein product [Notodromas monacha]|uniref:p53 DNA-binding domain-containing protein n=1 Tax=Notodromas monacha TaxID=399045 RepID=A0A7R9C2D1_9CRUS|nr:unnamed protein product [Notodromas monacha]CAG0924892.1 unnamed protein product [Notodromas monacha]